MGCGLLTQERTDFSEAAVCSPLRFRIERMCRRSGKIHFKVLSLFQIVYGSYHY